MRANCSCRAAGQAALKLSEQKDRHADDLLYERLVRIFPQQSVIRRAEIMGASNHKWRVASLVTLSSGRRAAFDFVANHHNSVASTAVKFHDLARLEPHPARISVVRDRRPFGDLLGVLSQASSVVELNASNE